MNTTVWSDGSLTNRLRRGKAGRIRGAASGVFLEYHDKTVNLPVTKEEDMNAGFFKHEV